MNETRREIWFAKAGMSYIPINLKGWFFLMAYCAVVVLFLVMPSMLFPESRIVSGYQVIAFISFWLFGLRIAKRRSA
ncbi:hypothetical protein [Sphingopyxis panaciterrae]